MGTLILISLLEDLVCFIGGWWIGEEGIDFLSRALPAKEFMVVVGTHFTFLLIVV